MTNEELMEIGLKAYGQEFRKGDRKGYRPYVEAVIAAILPEIDRLRAENETLRDALKPFADKADHHTQGAYWMDAIFTVDECRTAAAALKETGDE